MKRKRLLVEVLTAVCCFAPLKAYATPQLICSAEVGPIGTVPGVTVHDCNDAAQLIYPNNSEYALADAAFGTNRLNTAVSVTYSAGGPPYFAVAGSTWTDSITIHAAGLPDGTPAVILTDFGIHGVGTATNGGSWTELAQVILPGGYDFQMSGTPPNGWTEIAGVLHYEATSVPSVIHAVANDPSTSAAFYSLVQVGGTYNISVGMSGAGGTNPSAASTGGLDALHTANYTLDVLTPGVSYTSESGQIYDLTHEGIGVTGAPEPATLALLGIGLAGLGFSHRRKSS